MKIILQDICWKSKVIQKRYTLSISINKLIASNANLERGKILYSYLAKDKNKRAIIVTYLDSKKM
nr:hypothetical protein [Candidatus Woesearchaeota archaeon]